MARPRCKHREAALAKLESFKSEHPNKPTPPSLLTYFDEKGVRRYTVSGHDSRKASVTAAERYLSIARARRNELRLRIALDLVPMICFEWDIVEDKVRRLDPQRLDLSETSGPFHHFDAVLSAVHPDDRTRFHADIQRALESPESVFQSDVRVVNADGSVSWFSERGQIERDPRGRPLRLIGIAVDVTGHKTGKDIPKL